MVSRRRAGLAEGLLQLLRQGPIAVFCSPLDEAGNSVKAQDVIRYVAEKLNCNSSPRVLLGSSNAKDAFAATISAPTDSQAPDNPARHQ